MQHRGVTIWFTGLSGSGKTTISQAIQAKLRAAGAKLEVLDGDIVRTNLTKGLGFSKEDRDENVRRIGFVSHLLTRNGVIVMVSAISPYRDVRDQVRARIGDFVEVYAQASVEVCESRDVKGLYKKARSGEIKNFTGVSDPYEEPLKPEVVCDTENETLEESANKVMAKLEELGYISPVAV
ncbi:MAG: adenylyl-sulfate kinase [Cyanobacteria bacterium P01_F01_bin.116]